MASAVHGHEGKRALAVGELGLITSNLALDGDGSPGLGLLEARGAVESGLSLDGGADAIVITRVDDELLVRAVSHDVVVDGDHRLDHVEARVLDVGASAPAARGRTNSVNSRDDIITVEVGGGVVLGALIVVGEVVVAAAEALEEVAEGGVVSRRAKVKLRLARGATESVESVSADGTGGSGLEHAVGVDADGEVEGIGVQAAGEGVEVVLERIALAGTALGGVGHGVGGGSADGFIALIGGVGEELVVAVGGVLAEVTVRHVDKRVADHETLEVEAHRVVNELLGESREVVPAVTLRVQLQIGVLELGEAVNEANEELVVVGGGVIIGPDVVGVVILGETNASGLLDVDSVGNAVEAGLTEVKSAVSVGVEGTSLDEVEVPVGGGGGSNQSQIVCIM